MKLLKNCLEYLEVAAKVVVMLAAALILLAYMIILQMANGAFHAARCVVAFLLVIVGLAMTSYGARMWYLQEWNLLATPNGVKLFILMIALTTIVAIWWVVATALWQEHPDWLAAIELKIPEKHETANEEGSPWNHCWEIAGRIMDVTLIVMLVVVIPALPAIIGLKALAVIISLALWSGGTFLFGALLWPVIASLAWLPWRRKEKFVNFFCMTTQDCTVAIFGKPKEAKDNATETNTEMSDTE